MILQVARGSPRAASPDRPALEAEPRPENSLFRDQRRRLSDIRESGALERPPSGAFTTDRTVHGQEPAPTDDRVSPS